ncbi:MAG: CBS domain-containing protein [Pirellulales bacterium]|nr:CBS domain-containing protein [Pirellulales bacterium]
MSFQLSLNTESVSAAYPDQPLFVAPDASVGEVLQLLRAQRNGSVLVCETGTQNTEPGNGPLLGIFTERDALKHMSLAKGPWAEGGSSEDEATGGLSGEAVDRGMAQPVSAVMSPDPVCLRADTSVGEAIQTMSKGGYRHLPILNEADLPTGIATVYGILRFLVDHFPQTIYNLPPEPGAAPSEREGA